MYLSAILQLNMKDKWATLIDVLVLYSTISVELSSAVLKQLQLKGLVDGFFFHLCMKVNWIDYFYVIFDFEFFTISPTF